MKKYIRKNKALASVLLGSTFVVVLNVGLYSDTARRLIEKVTTPAQLPKTLSTTAEHELDIADAALSLAKEVNPKINRAAYAIQINRMVNEVRALTNGSKDPDYRIRVLNTYLFKDQGFTYDLSDPFAMKAENQFLNGTLDTRKGSCITLPLLYMAIAQRLGYPIKAVLAPGHLFLRYVDRRLKMQNIEPTSGGGYSSDEDYKARLKISVKAVAAGAYLRTLNNKEFLAELLAINASHWARKAGANKAFEYIATAERLNPYSPEVSHFLGQIFLLQDKEDRKRAMMDISVFNEQPPMNRDFLVKDRWFQHKQAHNKNTMLAQSYFQKADQLGFVEPSRAEYLSEVIKSIKREPAEEQIKQKGAL